MGPCEHGFAPAVFFCVYILYTDESEIAPKDARSGAFVLAGVSVFERQTHWLAKELEQIAGRFDADNPQNIELHGSPMLTGRKGFWRKQPKDERRKAIEDALRVLAESHRSNRVFAIVVEDGATEDNPMEYAYEQLASRFDQYLMRLHKKGERQRGMVLFDKSKHERVLQSLTSLYRDKGHRWGRLANFAEVPAFIDSRASRLIQLADLVAYAVNRWRQGDDRFYEIIRPRFDFDGGKTHGLHLKTKNARD